MKRDHILPGLLSVGRGENGWMSKAISRVDSNISLLSREGPTDRENALYPLYRQNPQRQGRHPKPYAAAGNICVLGKKQTGKKATIVYSCPEQKPPLAQSKEAHHFVEIFFAIT